MTVGVDGVLDIECANWDQFLAGGLYTPADGFRFFRDPELLLDAVLSLTGDIWAWNGGLYDGLWVIERLRRRELRAVAHTGGSRMTTLDLRSDLHLRDACALIPMGLDQAAEIAGMPPPGGPGFPCQCGRKCGGYCALRRRMSRERWKAVQELLYRDTTTAYAVLRRLQGHCAEQGYTMRGTLAGSAWATARDWIADLPSAKWRSGQSYEAVRAGYYGGRTTVLRPTADWGLHADMVSAYPSAMARTAVPVGAPIELGADRAGRAYRMGRPGIYEATVRVPDSFLPPLPMRTPIEERLCFPVGRMSGSWTALELAAAEDLGVEIEQMHTATVWLEEAVLFDDLMERWFAVRDEVGRETALGSWQKGLMTALSGKLAERPDRERVVLWPDRKEVKLCGGRGARCRRAGCTVNRCTEKCGSWRPIDHDGQVWGAPIWRLSAASHVHWAAYYTSAARIEWLRAARRHRESSLVYGAVDSLFVETPQLQLDLGHELQEWKPLGAWGEWGCLAPGVYKYVDGQTGELVIRARGLSRLDDKAWQILAAREQALTETRGVISLRQAATEGGGLFQRRRRHLQLREEPDGWYGDRRLRPGTGRTYPVEYTELLQREVNRASQDNGNPVSTRV